jgi:predicted nucleotidyltransferase component of viral defense system
MENILPRQPSHLSLYARACLDALVKASLADCISLGGALGLFHYLDYRLTRDVDAWWSDTVTEKQRLAVIQVLKNALATFGSVRVRSWGDVDSVELQQEGRTVFSFQVARRSAHLEEPVSAGWIDIPLDSLADLVASKMVALVERGAPRDFLDIYTLCQSGLVTISGCWQLWSRRQAIAGSDADISRAFLAIETHLERIALHRPLEKIDDPKQRQQARQVRNWFLDEFRQVTDE